MDAHTLAARLRGIVRPAGSATSRPEVDASGGVAASAADPGRLEALGGCWSDFGGVRSYVIERRIEPGVPHGVRTVGEAARDTERAHGQIALLAGSTPPAPLLFFDLETTGLNGGAGTLVFLVGCGRFEADGSFVTRQYFLASPAAETAMLRAVEAELGAAGALVSFNGKSFDVPVLETRQLLQRLACAASELPHVDILHAARLFWGSRQPLPAGSPAAPHGYGGRGRPGTRAPGTSHAARRASTCSLTDLERTVLSLSRDADVPGAEIPARYFHFVRTGDCRPLAAVLQHNRLDLLSLACLTGRLLALLDCGPSAAADAREAYALGRMYSRRGRHPEAGEAFERAAALATDCRGGRQSGAPESMRIAALRALAHSDRRARRHQGAADRWRAVIEAPGCPAVVAREAAEALAIHHEHRIRDLHAARALTLWSLSDDAGWTGQLSRSGEVKREAARYRLARLERKLEREEQTPRLPMEWPQPLSLPSLPSFGSQKSGLRTSS